MVTFKIIYLIGLASLTLIRLHYTGKNRRPVIMHFRSGCDQTLQFLSGLGLTVIPLVYIFTRWLAWADIPVTEMFQNLSGSVGTLVLGAALWLARRAYSDLGGNWSATMQIKDSQVLVTTGIYRRLRHPLYAANLLWGLAQLLLLPNWIAGPAMLVTFIPFYLVRIGREERMLRDHFGDSYNRYCKQTGRLWPHPRVKYSDE
ncbi:MAG TPA: protein-S-isoprenylcysteine O-methyltransferase [bacterium]|nr:protein-S-isoprenylcysteine O-methyltransferase [bacterium]